MNYSSKTSNRIYPLWNKYERHVTGSVGRFFLPNIWTNQIGYHFKWTFLPPKQTCQCSTLDLELSVHLMRPRTWYLMPNSNFEIKFPLNLRLNLHLSLKSNHGFKPNSNSIQLRSNRKLKTPTFLSNFC